MTLTKFEKILKQALILYVKERYPNPVGRCLSDKKMKTFASGKENSWNKNRRCEHLISCTACSKRFNSILNKL